MGDSENSDSDDFEPSQLAYILKNTPKHNTSGCKAGRKLSLSRKSRQKINQSNPRVIIGNKSRLAASAAMTPDGNKKTSSGSPNQVRLTNPNKRVFSFFETDRESVKITHRNTGKIKSGQNINCSEEVSNPKSDEVSFQNQTPLTSKTMVCSHCDKYFADPVVLTNHLYKVIEENANNAEEREVSSVDDTGSSDDDLCLTNETVNGESLNNKKLEGLPAVILAKPVSNTQKKYDIKYECRICNILIKSLYSCSKHRGEFHPEKKRKNIFRTISVPVEEQKMPTKIVPVVAIEGLNQIIVPHKTLQKSGPAEQKSHTGKGSMYGQSSSTKHSNKRHLTQPHSRDRPYSKEKSTRKFSTEKLKTSQMKMENYVCVKCKKVVDKSKRNKHWKKYHNDLEKNALSFLPFQIRDREEKHDRKKDINISRKRKSTGTRDNHLKQRRLSQMSRPESITETQKDDNSTDNSESSTQETIYQCGRCMLHTLSLETLSMHFQSCRSRSNLNVVKCKKCGLAFLPDELFSHNSRDHRNQKFDNFQVIKIVPTEPPANERKRDKVNLYKCGVCGLHFINENSLRTHFLRKNHDQLRHACNVCQYTFCLYSLNRHGMLHHDKMGLARKDFNVIIRNFGNVTEATQVRANMSTKKTRTTESGYTTRLETSTGKTPADARDISLDSEEENGTLDSQSEIDDTDSDSEEWTPSLEGENLQPAMTVPGFIKRKLKNNMHKCKKCSKIYFTKDNQRANTCSKCRDAVAGASQQPKKVSVAAQSSILTEAQREENEFAPNLSTKCDIFKCAICSIHFTASTTLNKHLSIEAHDAEVRISCPVCNLVFSGSSISRHTKNHHLELDLTIEDYNIITRSEPVRAEDNTGRTEVIRPCIKNVESENQNAQPSRSGERTNIDDCKKLYKCTICNMYFIERGSWRCHMAKRAHRPKANKRCTICHMIFSTKSLQRHVKLHHTLLKMNREDFVIIKNVHSGQSIVNKDKEKANRKDELNPQVSQQILNANVDFISTNVNNNTSNSNENIIYKCEECDVFFMKESSCCEHISMHIALGRLDFINCPECGLKFENNSLGEHRKTHHEKDNNLEAVVKTYKPSNCKLIVTNNTTDKLQSSEQTIIRPETIDVTDPDKQLFFKRIKITEKIVQELESQNNENIDLHDGSQTSSATNENHGISICTVACVHQNYQENTKKTELAQMASDESVIINNVQIPIEIQSVENINGNNDSITSVLDLRSENQKVLRSSELTSPRTSIDTVDVQNQQLFQHTSQNTRSEEVTETRFNNKSRESSDMTETTPNPNMNVVQDEISSENSYAAKVAEESIQSSTNENLNAVVQITENTVALSEHVLSDEPEVIEQSQINKEIENDVDKDVNEDNVNQDSKADCKNEDEIENRVCVSENTENETVEQTEVFKIEDEDTMCWWEGQVEIISSENDKNMQNQSQIKKLMKGKYEKNTCTNYLQNTVEIEHNGNINNAEVDQLIIVPRSKEINIITETNDCIDDSQQETNEQNIEQTDSLNGKPMEEQIKIVTNLKINTEDIEEFETKVMCENLSKTIEMNSEDTRKNQVIVLISSKFPIQPISDICLEEIEKNDPRNTAQHGANDVVNSRINEKDSRSPILYSSLSPYPETYLNNNKTALVIDTVVLNKNTGLRENSDTNIDAIQPMSLSHPTDYTENKETGLVIEISESTNTIHKLKNNRNDNSLRHETTVTKSLDKGEEKETSAPNDLDHTSLSQVANENNLENIDKVSDSNTQENPDSMDKARKALKLLEDSNSVTCGVHEQCSQLIENNEVNRTVLNHALSIQRPLENLPGNFEIDINSENKVKNKNSDEANEVTQRQLSILDGNEGLNNEIYFKNARNDNLERECDKEPTESCRKNSEDNQNQFMVFIPDNLLGEIKERLITISEENTSNVKVEITENNQDEGKENVERSCVVDEIIITPKSSGLYQSSKSNHNHQIKLPKASDNFGEEIAEVSLDDNETVGNADSTTLNNVTKQIINTNKESERENMRSPDLSVKVKEEGFVLVEEGIEITDDEEDDDVVYVSTNTEHAHVITVDESDDEADNGRKNTYTNIKIPQPIIVQYVSDDETPNTDEVSVKMENNGQTDIRKFFKQTDKKGQLTATRESTGEMTKN